MFDLLKEKISAFAKKVSGVLKAEEPEKARPEARRPEALKPEVVKPVERVEEAKKEVKERELKVKPSLTTQLKGLISPEVVLKEKDVSSALDDLELQLLEADVALPVVGAITEELKVKLVGKPIKYSALGNFIKESISETLIDIAAGPHYDLIDFVRGRQKPVKILFVGPNGTGKTTTIAKIAHMLKEAKISCVLAAADTFRAAAIEQTAEHAARLGVHVIKHSYGSDPAAVAFDAVKYAEAHHIDVVLIDSAGRQETSRNLVEQLKKMVRVVSPDLKIFVSEAIVGNAAVEQVSQFNSAIGLDGVILTKVDCDAKGGTVISIKKATGVPILYLGTGQDYGDLIPFDANFVVKRVLS